MNVYEAKTNLSRLLERVEGGERIVIARAGRPVADLVPHRTSELVFGIGKGQITIADDFDEPADDVIDLFEGN